MTAVRHATTRQRYELRRRTLTVTGIEDITPRMRRVTLASPELADFQSAGADDHIRLFFPAPDGGEPLSRDFTPRACDNAARTLVIDFALHAHGPATEWAAGAQIGSTLAIGGPRGSFIVPDDFDWYLFAGDESALPAMGRWVESLRAGVPVFTAALIADRNEIQNFSTQANWQAEWICRSTPAERDGELLLGAIREIALPPGDGYVWIAGEKELSRTLRSYFADELQHPHDWLKAASYWSRDGIPGEH